MHWIFVRLDWLGEYVGIEGGVRIVSRFERVLRLLNSGILPDLYRELLGLICPDHKQEAINGKAGRGATKIKHLHAYDAKK